MTGEVEELENGLITILKDESVLELEKENQIKSFLTTFSSDKIIQKYFSKIISNEDLYTPTLRQRLIESLMSYFLYKKSAFVHTIINDRLLRTPLDRRFVYWLNIALAEELLDIVFQFENIHVEELLKYEYRFEAEKIIYALSDYELVMTTKSINNYIDSSYEIIREAIFSYIEEKKIVEFLPKLQQAFLHELDSELIDTLVNTIIALGGLNAIQPFLPSKISFLQERNQLYYAECIAFLENFIVT